MEFRAIIDCNNLFSGYHLAAAIKKQLQVIGQAEAVQRFLNNSEIGIRLDHFSFGPKRWAQKLVMRLPADSIDIFLPLAGATLNVANNRLTLGTPSVLPLTPSPRLFSNYVTIKGFEEWNSFLVAAIRQINAYAIGNVAVSPLYRETITNRRVITIKQKRIVGFAIAIECVNAEQSLELQSRGIGGRRHFGAGIFQPRNHNESTFALNLTRELLV